MGVLVPAGTTAIPVCSLGYAVGEHGSGRTSTRVSSYRTDDRVNSIELDASGTSGGVGQ